MKKYFAHETANPGPLTLVNNDLVAITTLVGSAMNLATQSLLDADLSLAEKVIQADANIDTLCSAVEDRCLELLEDKRSTGSELRSIIGALRIAASLERMGDLAEHVALGIDSLRRCTRRRCWRPRG